MNKQKKLFWNQGFNYGIRDENHGKPKLTEEEIKEYFNQFLKGYNNGYEAAKGKNWFVVIHDEKYNRRYYNQKRKEWANSKEEATAYKTEEKAREVWKNLGTENDVVIWV